MRLIDADKLPTKHGVNVGANYGGLRAIVFKKDIDNAPTVDAEPVRHGRWVHGKELSRDYIGDACVSIHYDKWWCSECYYPVKEQPLWTYCPNCGAKMTLD